MKKMVVIVIGFFWVQVIVAQKGNDRIKVTDMLKIKTVGPVTLTNDGSRAAFTVVSTEPDGESKSDFRYVSQVFMSYTDGSAVIKQLTFSKEGSSQPAWSPDGKTLAFVRAVDGRSQLFLLPSDGGEAVQLTHYKYGAANPKWLPDGKQLLFSSFISFTDILKDSTLNPSRNGPSWPFEKPGFDKNQQFRSSTARPNPDGSMEEIRAYLEKDETDKKAKVLTKLNFQDETNVSSEMSFTRFFLINVQGATEPRPLVRGFYRITSVDFTPDGKQLILSGSLDSLRHPDRVLESQIFVADANGNNLRLLLGEKDKAYTNPRISPSGKWLAFQYGTTGFVEVPALAIMPLAGSLKDIIPITLDRSKSNVTWSSDEKYIYFIAQSNGGAPLYKADVSTKNVEQLSGYDNGILGFDVKGNKIVFARTDVTDPSALFIADAGMKNEKRIGNFNEWVKEKKISMPVKKTFVNDKGLSIEYWVMKPVNYEPGKKYPLLLEIHGGPSAMWGPGESSMWHEFQYFCSKGYGVVYCNPRGSGGYGIDFLRGNVNDWGNGPTSDVMTALDRTITEGWADTAKLVVTGGSYAGYLVAWIIGHDHRFKAACSQRGVYDLATFFGEGNAWRLVPNYFGGYPWEPKVNETLVRESPITYVQNITTPFIIFHGESDRRTGFVQGEMLYRSLKVLGRPVEYVRHPGGTHELTRSGDNRQRIDQMLRTYEFFERYLDPKGF